MLRRIGQKPPSDYLDPVGMLEDCHQRICLFLRTLQAVANTSGDAALTADRRDALEKALTYFREGAPKHTADEEESLFPRLRSADHPEARALAGTLRALEREHDRADSDHEEIDAIGRKWLVSGHLAAIEAAKLRSLIENLLVQYKRHIALEEQEVFAVARRILSEADRQGIGHEMAQRRGLKRVT